ncbi:hypothetical protein B0H19DRAFT_1079315 [Mycena capillaripes]|nr:hypothetical protein B0H19DRAFT_1079315 [Mycena capillaripes]
MEQCLIKLYICLNKTLNSGAHTSSNGSNNQQCTAPASKSPWISAPEVVQQKRLVFEHESMVQQHHVARSKWKKKGLGPQSGSYIRNVRERDVHEYRTNARIKTNGDIAVPGDPDKKEVAVTEIYQKRENHPTPWKNSDALARVELSLIGDPLALTVEEEFKKSK